MPYTDHEARKRVQREAQAQRRAAARKALCQDGLMSTPVNPALSPTLPPLPPPTMQELYWIGHFIGVSPHAHEDAAAYHERLRARWKTIRAVLEGG